MEVGVVHTVLLFSGGLDSLCAWFIKGKPECIHITGHSRYSWRERNAVQRIRELHPEMRVRVVEAEFLREFEEPDSNLPWRNAHFSLIAAHYGDHILLPCQRGEQSIPDRSPKFFEQVSEMLTTLKGRTVIVDPVFSKLTKQDVIEMYLKKGYPKETLLQAYSCFSSGGVRCGQCKACARTAVTLDYNRILPENYFRENVWDWARKNLDISQYEVRRAEQTRGVLERHL